MDKPSANESQDKPESRLKIGWRQLWRPGKHWWLFGMPIGGMLAVFFGILGGVGFTATMHLTNENAFCYYCHVGMDTVVEEYEASSHFSNQSGIAATCADCHVPQAFFPKLWVKIRATKDVYHQVMGTYNLDNFESHRLELAESVWAVMQANGSKECRSCHNPQDWDLAAQPARARTNHDVERWAEKEESCIDCHYGIAHKRPVIE